MVQESNNPPNYYILLGCNIGNKEVTIAEAIKCIEDVIGEVRQQSDNYYSAPWGFESTNEFVNAVVEVNSLFAPQEVLEKLLGIEKQLGRVRSAGQTTYADRVIDLDILLFGDVILSSSSLQIPHPRMHLRAFTLVPLLQVLPNGVHPSEGKSFRTILNSLKG